MRLCQPGPSARKAARTSGSRWSLVAIFVTSAFGRPCLTGASANFARHSGVLKSGRSSSKSGTVEGLFTGVGLSHADDAVSVGARSPCHEDHPAGKKTDCDVSEFSVFLAVDLVGHGGAVKHLVGLGHVETASAKGGVAFRAIVFDLHH